MKRTRAIEILTDAGIPHEIREFKAKEFTAEEAAAGVGMPLDQVYKTLVAQGERGVVMAVIPGSGSLSLRKLANVVGEKRMEMANVADLQRLTGYLKGGVSPLGSKRSYPVYIDESAILHERISVSAGQRGLQIVLSADDLARAADAAFADLAE
ncbi:Cys-tRNA(Pro) deacylase [Chloroflexia bacterium SDU3-3]|nr:Cys-tRNA(Pro) deacylase [Chloroflexia bacterium SDU3-3]